MIDNAIIAGVLMAFLDETKIDGAQYVSLQEDSLLIDGSVTLEPIEYAAIKRALDRQAKYK